MSGAMCLTTAQRRTRANMFGVTDTVYTQINITRPVLHIAIFSVGDAPCEVDDFHWAFLVGPSHEEADSKGLLCSMEPRQAPEHRRPYGGEWYWLYNQPTVHLRGQRDLLARLKIAEVASMKILQRIMLRWSGMVNMRQHVEWMSVRWLKQVLKDLNEGEECLGRRMESFDGVEAEGRWLAEAEEARRKALRLLDTRDEQDEGDTESDDTESDDSDESDSDEADSDEGNGDKNKSNDDDSDEYDSDDAGSDAELSKPESASEVKTVGKEHKDDEGEDDEGEDNEGEDDEDDSSDESDSDKGEEEEDDEDDDEDEGTQRP